MITFDPSRCCGCLACGDICPVGAIASSLDENGFIKPEVDTAKCIECGRCQKICAFIPDRSSSQNILSAYSFKLFDKDQLKQSTSGGAFTALSDAVLREGGVIIGAVMDNSFSTAHLAVQDSEGRDAMRLSKYTQSKTEGTFSLIESLLREGKRVMFVGTPCQCGEARRFIGEDEELLLCDFLCHGVPSEAFFKDHIHYLESCYQKKSAAYTFRGKRYGWNHGIEEITFTDGSRKDDLRVQAYSGFFQSGASLRESCHNCVYRSLNRPSDITIADFWGVEKITGKKDAEGVSLVFANSPLGEAYIEQMKDQGQLTVIDLERVLYRVSTTPAGSSVNTDEFWRVYREKGYEKLVERYADLSLKSSLKFEIKKRMLKK